METSMEISDTDINTVFTHTHRHPQRLHISICMLSTGFRQALCGLFAESTSSTQAPQTPHRHPQVPQCLHTDIHRLHSVSTQSSTGSTRAACRHPHSLQTCTTQAPPEIPRGSTQDSIDSTQAAHRTSQLLHNLYIVFTVSMGSTRASSGSTLAPHKHP